MTVEDPTRLPAPRHLVLAFMAGLSMAAGYSARCYVDELLSVLAMWRRGEGDV